jgi:uncharacterized membrane-anchored protein YitT (DUF2179 family)
VRDYALILLGTAVIAANVDMLLVPNRVVTGGLTGVAILLHHVLSFPVGWLLLGLNLPLLVLGSRYAGGALFLVRTLVGVVAVSAWIEILRPFVPADVVDDRLLVVVYGGILDGAGLALVFRGRGTTGGIDVLGRLARQRWGVPVGQSMLAMNALVYGGAAIVFGLEAVMLAFLLAFVSARTLDAGLQGLSASRTVLVITREREAVKEAILRHLGRGVTEISARGGFSGEERPILMVVVGRYEVARVRRRIMEKDPDAFVAVLPTQQVTGGFQLPREAD